MSSPLTYVPGLVAGARFLSALPRFMRRRFTIEEARAAHERWCATREERFLDFVSRAAYGRTDTVNGRLLRHAGVEEEDLRRLVASEGLEGALLALFEAGVYVTVDEFKGRAPLVRGSLRIETGPQEMRNPLAHAHVAAGSGGSRSRAAPFLVDLEYIRACGMASSLYFAAHGIGDALHGTWEAPGAGSRFRLLKYASFGEPPAAWFTPVDPDAPGLDPVFRVSELALRLGAGVSGVRLPRPVLATGADPLPVANWMREVLDAGRIPHLLSVASAGACLSLAAAKAGIDLTGAYMTLGGEPTTGARARATAASGLTGLPRYGCIEAGPVGYACAAREHPDEVHIVEDLHALVQPGETGTKAGLTEDAILLTALHPSAPYAMLNLSMGDRAATGSRDCGCAVRALGWRRSLHRIRSVEKFTAAGVTFHEREVIALLEEALPARFGGGPTDYQLVESEAGDGSPRLRILVDPGVGPLEERELRRALLGGLGDSSPVGRMMEKHLENFVEIDVERRTPLRTRSGKVLHLHVENRSSSG